LNILSGKKNRQKYSVDEKGRGRERRKARKERK